MAQPLDEVVGLRDELNVLEGTGRCGQLLASLLACNNRANFLAFVLEATFAYQFGAAGMVLAYEVRQTPGQKSSIEFRHNSAGGNTVYFELRLLQQDQATANMIAAHLQQSPIYQVVQGGIDDQANIARLQGVILSKVQSALGTPIKYLMAGPGIVKFVVVCVDDDLQGLVDAQDCILAMYGDPEVPEHCRRGIFGLFQDSITAYPAAIQRRAQSFHRIKSTLHGVMFLFKRKPVVAGDH